MQRFKFRLQTILNYRHILKKDQARELAERNQLLDSAQTKLQEILEAQDANVRPNDALMSMAEVALSGNYQRALREALVNQRLMVLDAAGAVEQAQDAYVERAREVEVLETLRKRRREKHSEEQALQEKKNVDEIVVQRYGHAKANLDDGGNDE